MVRSSIILAVAASIVASTAFADVLSDFPYPQAKAVDVIILGEQHHNHYHHQTQAELITRIKPAAVVFEHLTPKQATAFNNFNPASDGFLGAHLDWAGSGWGDFAIYAPIFEALDGVPVYGAALPSDQVRASVTESAAAVFAGDAALFGLNRPLPEGQLAQRKQLQFDAHCGALPMEMTSGLIEAQRLRDASFAARVLDAYESHGAPIILLTGNGHARTDWGVPHALATAAPTLDVFAVQIVEDIQTVLYPSDHTIVTEAVDIGDPCDAFR